MAVTGVFTADFSNFDKAVEQSEARLKGLESTGTKVESSLRLMTQSQEALLNQIGAAGGRFQDLGAAAGETTGKIGSLTDTYHQFDGVLKAVGLNVGPVVAGFSDISAAAAGGAAALGVLGTTAAVFAAAITGWKLGRVVSEFLGLDEAIGLVTTKLKIFNDVAAETAGAKQDTINRAIAQGAKETISYTEAIKFNTEAAKVNADTKINWTQKLADAYKEVRNVNDATKEEIAIAQEAGATTEELTNKYGLSAKALEILAEKHRETSKATEEHRAAQEKLNAEAAAGLKDFQAQTDAAKAWQPVVDKQVKDRDAAAVKKAEQDAAALVAQGQATEAVGLNFKAMTEAEHAAGGYSQSLSEVNRINLEAAKAAQSLAQEQAKIDEENKKIIDAANAAAKAHTDAGTAAEEGTKKTVQGYQAVQQQITITGDAIKEWTNLMRYSAQAQAILGEGHLFTTQSQRDRIANIPSFAGGVENFEGGLAKVHAGELLVNLPGGTSVIPKGAGGNVTMSNTFNLVDSESNLARRVSELIMRSVRAGTQLGTT